jgi:hypothetical protein
MKSWRALFTGFCVGFLWIGCAPEGTAPMPVETESARDSVQTPSSPVQSREARQAEFLNRIRESDPQYRVVQRALINENNELGLILGRDVEMDAIPKLMRGMLVEMAKEFPGEDLTVIAYAPAEPPIKLGTAHLNAQTRDMTYTPAQQ